MPPTAATLQESALLVIDVQDSFKLGPRWERRSNPALEANCETTTRVAADLGYQVDFVLDATLTFPIQHWVDGRVAGELGVAEIAERTCYALRGRFARIVDTAQLIAELVG